MSASAVLLRSTWFAALSLCSAACAAGVTVSVDESHGLPAISRGGASALTSTFLFWGKNWAWADQQARFKIIAPSHYTLTATNQTLDMELKSTIRKPSPQVLVWEFDLDVRRPSAQAIGGGIAFKFDATALGPEFGAPRLLGDNRGWAWGAAGGKRVEMRFDPPLATVHFEGRNKDEIRAFFYKGEVPQGRRRHVATLAAFGDIALMPTWSERFGLDDPGQWPQAILDPKSAPVDLSFLNESERPAGKHGFLKVRQDQLIFEDGTPVRFWGTNLTAYALFGTPREEVKHQARRLSQLGFNLVRLHHHDSPWVVPNVFGDQKTANTQHLNGEVLEKLDWWIKCLKDEGIYIWLDLHVQRNLKPGDGIYAFDEIAKGKPQADLKGFSYVNPSIQQAMKRFNEGYVNRANVYTKTRYKDEPAIVAMMISNENDITNHFGNALLPNQNVPKHHALYNSNVEAFAAARGLPRDKTWRSWEHGPSKLFLNDLERRFNVDMIAHLRGQGVRVPIATTSTWGGNPLSSLPALTAGDVVDVHAYGGVGELEKSPLHAANLAHWLAAAHVAGKPLTVTEWNVERFPAPDRHAIPLYVGAAASMQGWDAIMQYAYSQEAFGGHSTATNWHAYNDPAMIATLPAAALLYRQGHVREASTIYAFAPPPEALYYRAISPANSVALRSAAEKGKLVVVMPQTKELPWLEKGLVPAGAKVMTDPSQSLLRPDANEVVSDSGELRRNWQQGTFIVDTPRTQAASGWLGNKPVILSDAELAISTRYATVAIQSLDGNPIRESADILISLGARSEPKAERQVPYFSEPVQGTLHIRAPKGLKLYVKRDASGARPMPAPYEAGRYLIKLDKSLGTYWLFLR